jgi:hypothetical protein
MRDEAGGECSGALVDPAGWPVKLVPSRGRTLEDTPSLLCASVGDTIGEKGKAALRSESNRTEMDEASCMSELSPVMSRDTPCLCLALRIVNGINTLQFPIQLLLLFGDEPVARAGGELARNRRGRRELRLRAQNEQFCVLNALRRRCQVRIHVDQPTSACQLRPAGTSWGNSGA